LNSHFNSPDGGLYVVCEVKPAEFAATEVTGIWIDGPHPTSRLG
jgi:hypothetical protein